MPIYQYRCEKCGHKFKALQKYSDKIEMLESGSCKKCGEKSLKEVVSKTFFHLKGGGWAKNGYD